MLSTVEKVLFLKSIDLFSQIPGEDLAQVALGATEEVREAGEEIFSAGEPSEALYVVLNGKVRVERPHRPAQELGSRECLGELGLLDGALREGTATAAGECSLLKVSRGDFLETLAERPQIAVGILRVLARRLRSQPR